MAQTSFSLLLLRRRSLSSKTVKNLKLHLSSLQFIANTNQFSTSPLPPPNPPTSASLDPQAKPSSLSSRMSFIFDQIDRIEKGKQENDQTLQRIRAWRQSKQHQQQTEKNLETVSTQKRENEDIVSKTNGNEIPEVISSVEENPKSFLDTKAGLVRNEVELVHPWTEWIELMERLVKQNYFDHRRKDEDKMVKDLGFGDVVEDDDDDVGIDFNDFKTVQTACLNFGKDRFDILRSLSGQDIQILVGYGCPNVDKKVVFSAKLLRKRVHLDEGEVCSSCSLRNSCERAYLLTNKEDEARTIDVMRVLLTYGFDSVNGSVLNKALLKQKSVKTVIRKLLHEIVKLSAVPIDPNLPPPVIKKPPPKVKQPPPPPKKRVGRDDIEMKKGDWLCPKCDFMNFAKNTVCLQCDAKRPKRQLLPGEWECPQCNFLNYRRNMACFHCDCKRPPDEFVENKMQERQRGPDMKLEKVASRLEVANAWNFNFDDDESDGADVAAFEYADAPVRGEDLPLAREGNFGGYEDGFNKASRAPRAYEREYTDPHTNRPGVGFDDFDDEDDVDSYEIDVQNNHSGRKASPNNLSEFDRFSEEEDRGSDNNYTARSRATSPSHNRPSKPTYQKAAYSGSEDDELGFDTDDDLAVHPNWRSSHVADSSHRSRASGPTGPSRGLSFGSDEEYGLHSDLDDDLDEDFRSKRTKGNKNKPVSSRNFKRRASSGMEDDSFSDSESDIDDLRLRKNRSGENKREHCGRGNNFKGRRDHSFIRDTQFKSSGGPRGNHRGSQWEDDCGRGNNFKGRRDHSFIRDTQFKSSGGPCGNHKGSQRDDDCGRGNNFKGRRDHSVIRDTQFKSSGGPRGNRRGSQWDDNDGWGMNNRKGDSRNFRRPKEQGYGNLQRGRSYKYSNDADGDSGEFRNSRRVIER